jgi:hypothetical protein
MELIAAVLLAGPLGFVARRRKQGLLLYLLVWALIFPVQTVVVYADSDPAGNDALYWVFNALILALGIGLNELGHRAKRRRVAAAS